MTAGAAGDSASEVLATVRAAAAEALARGAAELSTTTVEERYGAESTYDAPVVVLAPRNPRAAEVLIEVQAPDVWWLSAGGGPPYEFYPGMPGHWHDLLRDLVWAVIGGRYRVERREELRRLLLRPWRRRCVVGWASVFETRRGRVTTTHFGATSDDPYAPQAFEPY